MSKINEVNCVMFCHSILDEYDLSLAEFRVYAHLARRLSANTREAWPGIRSMARICNASNGTIQKAVELLEAARLICVNRKHGESNCYSLLKPTEWVASAEMKKLRQAIVNRKEAHKEGEPKCIDMRGGCTNTGNSEMPVGVLNGDTPVYQNREHLRASVQYTGVLKEETKGNPLKLIHKVNPVEVAGEPLRGSAASADTFNTPPSADKPSSPNGDSGVGACPVPSKVEGDLVKRIIVSFKRYYKMFYLGDYVSGSNDVKLIETFLRENAEIENPGMKIIARAVCAWCFAFDYDLRHGGKDKKTWDGAFWCRKVRSISDVVGEVKSGQYEGKSRYNLIQSELIEEDNFLVSKDLDWKYDADMISAEQALSLMEKTVQMRSGS